MASENVFLSVFLKKKKKLWSVSESAGAEQTGGGDTRLRVRVRMRGDAALLHEEKMGMRQISLLTVKDDGPGRRCWCV